MTYRDLLKTRFPALDPEVDDLFLLEAHQIAGLPERAPGPELAAVLHADPRLYRFLISRHPPIEPFLTELLSEHGPVGAPGRAACEHAVVWELADWIVYQRAPEYYDATSPDGDGDLAAATDVVPLDGKVVIDAGAGTGRLALAAAPIARRVFAVEPVATLRRHMRQRATRLGIANVFVLDGFLHAIPLPAGAADVLITSRAIGWNLEEEVSEIERVVKPGGTALHLFDTPQGGGPALGRALVAHGYQPFEEEPVLTHRYWKRMPG